MERSIVIIAFLVTVALCGGEPVFAQNENVFLHPQKFYKKYLPNLRIQKDLPDSSYIKAYPNYLSASVRLSSPSVRIDFTPRVVNPGGRASFRTNIGDIVGAAVTYRYISAGFAFVMNSGMQVNTNYQKSRYRTATINYNSRGNIFQFKYIRIKGLTDVRTNNKSETLIHRPDIVTKEFQFENTYNPSWKKYSYTAPFTFSERQVKSYGGFLFKTGIYYAQVSGDSSLIHHAQFERSSAEVASVNVIRSLSIRLAPGAGGNVVIREKYYVSAAIFPSYDIYFYKYMESPDDKVMGDHTLAFSLEGNASIGYQSRRLYAGIRCEIERNSVTLQGFQSKKTFANIGLEFGYRFTAPRFVQKVYRTTMPPGM